MPSSAVSAQGTSVLAARHEPPTSTNAAKRAGRASLSSGFEVTQCACARARSARTGTVGRSIEAYLFFYVGTILRHPRIAPNADEARPADLERRHALRGAQVTLHHLPHRLAPHALAHPRPAGHLVAPRGLERVFPQAQLRHPAPDLRARRARLR